MSRNEKRNKMMSNHGRSNKNKRYSNRRRKRNRSDQQRSSQQKGKVQHNDVVDNDDVMKDILAQLQLQRSKQNKEQKDTSHDTLTVSKKKIDVVHTYTKNGNSKHHKPPKLGNYVYDSKRDKYFPSNSANDDHSTNNAFTRNCSQKYNSTSKENIDKSLFITSNYPLYNYNSKINNQVKFWQYRRTCVNPRLRHLITQDWIASIVGGCNHEYKRIVPVTVSNIKNHWYSMLCPIPPQSNNGYNQTSSIPLDCVCKSYLHPSAPTFDVLASAPDKNPALPHVVTIVHGGGVYYRPPKKVKHETLGWRVPSQNNHNEGRYIPLATGLGPTTSNDCYRSIQFCPYKRNLSFSNSDVDLYVGAIAKDRSRQSFTMGYCSGENTHLSQHNFLNYAVALPVPVNSFCFSPYLWNAPGGGNVEFAPNTMGKSLLPAMSLDLETMTLLTISKWKNPASDAFCVDYFTGDEAGNTILYGHRNGTISILDKRSGKFSFVQNHNNFRDSFGSTTSITMIPINGHTFDQPHSDVRNKPNQILAKGCFGGLHLHDLRCLHGFDGTSRNRRHSNRSLVQEFQRPESMTCSASQRCNGIVIDPKTSSIMVSPFMSDRKDHFLGVWSLSSGKIIHVIPLSGGVTNVQRRENSLSSQEQQKQPSNNFCELSKTTTNGWCLDNSYKEKCVIEDYIIDKNEYNESVHIRQREGSWGVWTKCGNALYNFSKIPPPETGGIHHVTFQ